MGKVIILAACGTCNVCSYPIRLDVWVCSSGLLGPAAIHETTPTDMQKCFEANSMVPFFALKYGPPAMAKTTPKGSYPNAAPKDQKYGSIVVVSSVASTYGGKATFLIPYLALGVIRVTAAETTAMLTRRLHRLLGPMFYNELACCSWRSESRRGSSQRYVGCQDIPSANECLADRMAVQVLVFASIAFPPVRSTLVSASKG